MRILILCNDHECYSTVRLAQTAAARGHAVQLAKAWDFCLWMEQGKGRFSVRGEECPGTDALIPRLSAAHRSEGAAVLRHLAESGVFSLNRAAAVAAAHDKFETLQRLSRAGVRTPASALVLRPADILPAIRRLGGAPVIIKPRHGCKGEGVILAESEDFAARTVEALQGGENVLLQEFIAESRGEDLRAFVIGGRIAAAVRRKAKEGEFRSNLHQGGTAEAATLEPAYAQAALSAAAAVGLEVAGVDLLRTRAGPTVLEVNASPGLEGIERATGLDLAGAIISRLEEQIISGVSESSR